MIEYNHKGEQCIYKDILCQEGVCSGCNIAINKNKDVVKYICEKLNTEQE